MAFAHAGEANDAGVPVPALLSSLSFAHSQTLKIIAAKLGENTARIRELADIVQRLALVEADAMTTYLGQCDAQRGRNERIARSDRFRDDIAESIQGTANLGMKIRVQAQGASSSTRGSTDSRWARASRGRRPRR